ncbi:hypothetical protein F5Y01DRAFT_300446 [Xylaria sp. FL0043]|nr:hypothetical protein F5Y01DRAFT_300446 [Xylaria sp. FL0043]
MRNFFRRSLGRLHRKIANTTVRGYERYLYIQSPLELTLAINADNSSGNSAIATTLLCISQFADIIV